MSIQGPVVDFEFVDKDFHWSSDLIDLEQQMGLFSLIGSWMG